MKRGMAVTHTVSQAVEHIVVGPALSDKKLGLSCVVFSGAGSESAGIELSPVDFLAPLTVSFKLKTQ